MLICFITSVMIYDLGRAWASSTMIYFAQSRSRYVDESSPEIARYHIRIPTARTATLHMHKHSSHDMSRISDVCMDGPYHPNACDRLTTVVIEIVLPVGNLLLMICSKQAVSCHVCFNFSRLDSRLPVLHSGNSPSHDHPPSAWARSL